MKPEPQNYPPPPTLLARRLQELAHAASLEDVDARHRAMLAVFLGPWNGVKGGKPTWRELPTHLHGECFRLWHDVTEQDRLLDLGRFRWTGQEIEAAVAETSARYGPPTDVYEDEEIREYTWDAERLVLAFRLHPDVVGHDLASREHGRATSGVWTSGLWQQVDPHTNKAVGDDAPLHGVPTVGQGEGGVVPAEPELSQGPRLDGYAVPRPEGDGEVVSLEPAGRVHQAGESEDVTNPGMGLGVAGSRQDTDPRAEVSSGVVPGEASVPANPMAQALAAARNTLAAAHAELADEVAHLPLADALAELKAAGVGPRQRRAYERRARDGDRVQLNARLRALRARGKSPQVQRLLALGDQSTTEDW